MALVDSLLSAIVRADGDALVLHAGERPYVVAPSGQSVLASKALTLDAMKGMLTELLPSEARHALNQDGAVQHHVTAQEKIGGEGFTVVAAEGGNDIWIEIRRHRKNLEIEEPVPAPIAETALEAPPEPISEPTPEPMPKVVPEPIPGTIPAPVLEQVTDDEPVYAVAEAGSDDTSFEAVVQQSTPEAQEPEPEPLAPELLTQELMSHEWEHAPAPEPDPEPVHILMPPPAAPALAPVVAESMRPTAPRREQAHRFTPLQSAGIDRLLRIAAEHGASVLYLTSQSKPSIRVDGEISAIEGEPALSEPEVEAMMLDIIPEQNREALRSQAGTEWISDVPDVGRVHCVTFRDHRGAGGIFRMIPARAISAERLGLSREIQGLCAEADGLVLITGPRASGKSTLISSFVDLINRSRSDHVITLENEIKFVHENRLSLISQREVGGDHAELMNAARAALRENPDVLAIEDLGSPEAVTLALQAAQSGHLVIGALTAHTAAEAVDRVIDQAPPERRPKIQLALAEALRGVVGQVLLRKSGGGRVAAREVLLNTSAVANLIAEGKTSQLPMAIDNGRKHGMVLLNDALASVVRSGVVDSREAYRQASDQSGFLSLLKRQGIDTSFVERLA